ncbi:MULTISPECIES: MFS transporter [Pseudoalteromonas]|uniref:Major facilitator superfamily (MFS) profile domain-containing protein n=1 Tax=Pseudoalteromonas amylolytica TaxID=1859457 RepID=A0A1S1MQU6_9GAMM|nr:MULTISPECIES: MFS transporter [Pseudoalteromonas]OHU86693.1 hypothetical protein BFC16_14400 [Pseudoalteromonas sp. JW3]OHU88783.1 hypothetical protein BET10_18355 [Pseudoalteromonas amylolytica]
MNNKSICEYIMLKHIRLGKVSADSMLGYLFMAFVAMVGLAYLNFLPSVVDALVGGMGLSESQAGQVVALNGYGALLGLMGVTLLIDRLPWRSMLFVVLALLCAVDIGTVWLNDNSLIHSLRFIGGVLGGMGVGIAFTILAKLHNGDRAFGLLLLMQFGIGSLVIYVLPMLKAWGGELAVFYVMAALCALGLMCTLLLPNFNAQRVPASTHESHQGKKSQSSSQAYRLLFAMSTYLIAASAIWSYVGQIGLKAGFDEHTIHISIALTGLLGLAGAMLPIIGIHRVGRCYWLMIGVALSIGSAVLLCFSHQLLAYVIAMSLLFFAWPAVHSYLLSLITQHNNHVKLASIAALVSYGALATGPMLGSVLLSKAHFSIMLSGCALLFALSFLLLIKPVLRHKATNSKPLNSPSHQQTVR